MAQRAHDAQREAPGEQRAHRQRDGRQHEQRGAALGVVGRDALGGGVDLLALVVGQVFDGAGVDGERRAELGVDQHIGFVDLLLVLELVERAHGLEHDHARRDHRGIERLFFRRGEHGFQLLLRRRDARRTRRLELGEIGRHLGVGGLDHRVVGHRVRLEQAEPFGRQPFLDQRALHHLVGRLAHVREAQHARARNERHQQQQHREAEPQAGADFQILQTHCASLPSITGDGGRIARRATGMT
ncbi:hypothetical protein D3C72_1259600 [compost metagenome]